MVWSSYGIVVCEEWEGLSWQPMGWDETALNAVCPFRVALLYLYSELIKDFFFSFIVLLW